MVHAHNAGEMRYHLNVGKINCKMIIYNDNGTDQEKYPNQKY